MDGLMRGNPANLSNPNPGPGGSLGTTYGIQMKETWAAGEGDLRPVLDNVRAESLWRVSVSGEVLLNVKFGTGATVTVTDVIAPLVAGFPGMVGLDARPIDSSRATVARVTLTPATAAGPAIMRQLLDATAGAVDFNPLTVRYTAYTASTVQVAGIGPIAVVAGQTLPITAGSPSQLLSGSGIGELEP